MTLAAEHLADIKKEKTLAQLRTVLVEKQTELKKILSTAHAGGVEQKPVAKASGVEQEPMAKAMPNKGKMASTSVDAAAAKPDAGKMASTSVDATQQPHTPGKISAASVGPTAVKPDAGKKKPLIRCGAPRKVLQQTPKKKARCSGARGTVGAMLQGQGHHCL